MLHKDVLRLLAALDLGGVYEGDLEIEGKWLDQLQADAEQLLREATPDRTSELLGDWERNFGLPDPCAGQLDTLQARRAALLAAVNAQGKLTRGYYVQLAAALGYAVTITEFPVATATTLAAGDGLGTEEAVYVWRVDAPDAPTYTFRVGQSRVGERLRTWGNPLLECVIRRLAPAHTTVLFGYGG